MLQTVISKPIYRVLSDLTQQPRIEVALPLAVKDWVRLKLADAETRIQAFERRYDMDFAAFQHAWQEDRISDRYSYEVESDYWEWEAAVADRQRLMEM